MAAKKLDAGTLRHVVRLLRNQAVKAGDQMRCARQDNNEYEETFWSGSIAAQQGMADWLLEEARRLEKAKAPK